jgi:putative DNA-invertase from lambdoid prophage Rac
MATYGYTRVSTGRQAEDGESLGAQQRKIEGYAMMQGMQVDSMFVERGISGSTPLGERPEGAKMLSVLQPGDTIITPKLDRMFRSALNALDVLGKLKDGGVSLHMIDLGGDVTGNGISKLVFTILSAVAEAERDRIRERIRDVKADQKKRNRYLGGTVPFGWKLSEDGELAKDEDQQAAIKRMKSMQGKGASLRAISADLAERGFTLSHAGVANVLAAGTGELPTTKRR